MPSKSFAFRLAMFLSALAPPCAWAQASIGEYDLKAALLYNFTRFVEWPTEGGGDFRLCVAGRNPFGASLDPLATRTVRDRPIRIEHKLADFRNCQMVFVPAGIPVPLFQPGLLVVAEEGAALGRGAAIVLGMEGGRVVFDISQDAADRANLKVSYKLLRLARTLGP